MAQLLSERKLVLLSCVKGMLLSLGGSPGPCFQESCKDHPQSNGSEHSVVQCFLMGTQSNFLLVVQGSPLWDKSHCALDREDKGKNSGEFHPVKHFSS